MIKYLSVNTHDEGAVILVYYLGEDARLAVRALGSLAIVLHRHNVKKIINFCQRTKS